MGMIIRSTIPIMEGTIRLMEEPLMKCRGSRRAGNGLFMASHRHMDHMTNMDRGILTGALHTDPGTRGKESEKIDFSPNPGRYSSPQGIVGPLSGFPFHGFCSHLFCLALYNLFSNWFCGIISRAISLDVLTSDLAVRPV